MTDSLLLMAWPWNNTILTSFRYATAYAMPDVYNGTAKLTQISSHINDTHFDLIFRCENCLAWTQDGQSGSASTSSGILVLGWAQATPSPRNAQCPDAISVDQHNNGMNIFGASLDSHAASSNYTAWTKLATTTVVGDCSNVTTTNITATPVPADEPAWDYIVIGGGAGGITVADRLSESGKSVLLIEKGPASLGRWGGQMRPDWLDGTNLTRFDVPGLCNEIWVNAGGVTCTDLDQVAGCVLGGGTAVNAGLWWKPHETDWDVLFPTGWKSSDMANATNAVFTRIPGTDHPSMDGKLYLQQGFDVLTSGLAKGGWKNVTANDSPNAKNHTYAHTAYMYADGQRGGPMTTYLVSATGRSNFKMWLNTSVTRINRVGGHAVSIDVEAYDNGGYQGTVNLTATTGRVVVSAGTFGSAKLLLRSGIGPTDQLEVVQRSSDGPTMIDEADWINLPVGYNLDDHLNTDTVITHPDVVFYDFYAAWDAPNATDENLYLGHRAGILAQAAPNIGPMFWDEIVGTDGSVRQLQWTARVEGSDGTPSGNAMTLSQYLGRGSTSRGRMTITEGLDTVVSTLPWLHDPQDRLAVIQGIKNVQSALALVPNLTYTYPPSNQTVEDFVDNVSSALHPANFISLPYSGN
jgi:cellobiose dehydrogenase (acceptor)